MTVVTEDKYKQIADEALVRRCQAGDRDATSQLVQRHQERIMRVCQRLLLSHADAQDACQDIFIKAVDRIHTFHPSAQFTTWLYRIAVNHCLNVLRSRRRRQWLAPFSRESEKKLLEVPAAEDDPLQQTEKRERQREVRRALALLPEEQRLAVVLHRYEGLSYEEIAQVLQVSVPAVESRLHRAKQNLLRLLESYMNDQATP